jgi:dynactin complex subunit
MANDYGKILDKIAADNAALDSNEKRLQEAFEKLDQRLNVLRAGVRIEPYPISKDGPSIGFRRFQNGWHITTILEGLAGLSSEIPALEAEPALQVALVGEVGGLLDKISKSIAGKVKASTSSVKEAESLLDALP